MRDVKMIIEKNRRAYKFSNNENEKNIITLIQTNYGWEMLAFGWEYKHWQVIGERGGLAEAGEIKFYGRIKTSIEQYIQAYRQLFTKVNKLEDLFKDFEIKGAITFLEVEQASHKKVKETMIEKFTFTKISSIQFEKTLSIQDCELLSQDNITFSFFAKSNLSMDKPIFPEDQLTLF